MRPPRKDERRRPPPKNPVDRYWSELRTSDSPSDSTTPPETDDDKDFYDAASNLESKDAVAFGKIEYESSPGGRRRILVEDNNDGIATLFLALASVGATLLRKKKR